MHFIDARAELGRSNQLALDQVIDKWRKEQGKKGGVLMDNLEHERFLDELSFMQLLNTIVENEKSSIEDLKNEVSSIGLYRRGGSLEQDGKRYIPRFVGTIVPRKFLEKYLRTKYQHKFSDEKKYKNLLKGVINDERTKKYEDVHIREDFKSIWFSWNPDNPEDTLEYMNAWSKEDARCGLGLGYKQYKNTGLVALVFVNPEFLDSQPIILHRPTFIDAGFDVHFRPTSLPLKDKQRNEVTTSGLTFALSRNPVFIDKISSCKGNMPEAVGESRFYPLKYLHRVYFLNKHKNLRRRKSNK